MGTKPQHSKTQKFILIIGVIVAIVAGLNTQVKATTSVENSQQMVKIEAIDGLLQKIKSAPEVIVKAVLPNQP